jgi:hypothetical protein
MAVEELEGQNSLTVLCFSPSCSTSRDGGGRTGRQASDLKVAKFPNCSLFQSILFYIPRWPWMNWEAGINLKMAKFLNCFLFQPILFYIPRWLWKNWEAGIRS